MMTYLDVSLGMVLLGLELFFVFVASGESEVAYFEVAVFVDENVAWLEVAVDDVCGVHVEEPPEDLVDEVLDVLVGEFLAGVDDAVEVCFHELGDDVDVVEAGLGVGLVDVEEADDVLVLEEL